MAAMPAPTGSASQAGDYWWRAQFEMEWEDGRRVDFSRDLIVAHEVIAPILTRHAGQIALWRFHRRAARDAAGHQFSFIFYAGPETAAAVFEEIRLNRTVERLLAGGDLVALRLDDPGTQRRADIAGTSDRNWPASIQKSWPYFIMGVSLMWLDLLEQTVDVGELAQRQGIPERLEYYGEVHAEMTELWQRFGRHALLHHINAIYGYEPLELVF